MAWSASKIFSAYVTDVLNNTTAMDANSDSIKAALYNNSITPDQTAASASTAYNTGQWAVANEVSNTTHWPAGGIALTGVASGFASNVYTFDAADTPSVDSAATLANVYGCEVYDDTIAAPVAKQGMCFNYFGGANSVTNGSFTVVWNASGIFALTL
jgi:hypothetical protein